MKLSECKVGQTVDVKASWYRTNILKINLYHDFTGIIVEVNSVYTVVKDQDDNCWSCEPEHLTLINDKIEEHKIEEREVIEELKNALKNGIEAMRALGWEQANPSARRRQDYEAALAALEKAGRL